MIVHVRDFGKIEYADIDLSQLDIFIGDNNSGKTYLMQLICGLLSYLSGDAFKEELSKFSGLEIVDYSVQVKKLI